MLSFQLEVSGLGFRGSGSIPFMFGERSPKLSLDDSIHNGLQKESEDGDTYWLCLGFGFTAGSRFLFPFLPSLQTTSKNVLFGNTRQE